MRTEGDSHVRKGGLLQLVSKFHPVFFKWVLTLPIAFWLLTFRADRANPWAAGSNPSKIPDG